MTRLVRISGTEQHWVGALSVQEKRTKQATQEESTQKDFTLSDNIEKALIQHMFNPSLEFLVFYRFRIHISHAIRQRPPF